MIQQFKNAHIYLDVSCKGTTKKIKIKSLLTYLDVDFSDYIDMKETMSYLNLIIRDDQFRIGQYVIRLAFSKSDDKNLIQVFHRSKLMAIANRDLLKSKIDTFYDSRYSKKPIAYSVNDKIGYCDNFQEFIDEIDDELTLMDLFYIKNKIENKIQFIYKGNYYRVYPSGNSFTFQYLFNEFKRDLEYQLKNLSEEERNIISPQNII